MSPNSPFSVDEYPLFTGSFFSIEEYCISLSNIETLQSGRQNNVGKQGSQSMSQSHEFSVDEYDPNEESTSVRNVYQSSTSVSSCRQTNVGKQGSQSMSLSDAYTYIQLFASIFVNFFMCMWFLEL